MRVLALLFSLLAAPAMAQAPTVVQNLQVQHSLQVTPAPVFTALTGYAYCNGSSVCTASTTIPGAALAAGAALANIGAGGITSTYLASGTALANIGAGGITSTYLAAGAAVGNIGSQGLTAALFNGGVGDQIWQQNGAFIYRMGDRAFIGGAQADDGTNHTNKTQDWLGSLVTQWNSIYTVSTATWAAGQATFSVSGTFNGALGSAAFPAGGTLVVSGVTPSGYNGSWAIVSAATSSVTVTMANDPTTYTSGGTFFTQSLIGYSDFAQAKVLTNTSPASGTGMLAAAQTANATGPSYGGIDFGVANNAATNKGTWARYIEAHSVAGTGAASAMELDMVNHQASHSQPTPNTQGTYRGIQFGCGGQYTNLTLGNCDVAMQVIQNGATWNTAINVMRGSITGTNAAILLPTGNGIAFADAAGHVSGGINANFSTGAQPTFIQFSDSGFQIIGASGVNVFASQSIGTTSVNYLLSKNAATNNRPSLNATGTDTNVDLDLITKGTGVVRAQAFSSISGTHPTLSGTCASTTSTVGGDTVGTISFGAACASGTVILTFHETATNGWRCGAADETTPAATLKQTAHSTTSVTLTATGVASADAAVFSCMAF